jgi:hypothetical protein
MCPSAPHARMARTAACDPTASASTLTSSISRHASGSPSASGPRNDTPALLTITSSRPVSVIARSTRPWTAPGSRRSAATPVAAPPAPATACTVPASASARRPAANTMAFG